MAKDLVSVNKKANHLLRLILDYKHTDLLSARDLESICDRHISTLEVHNLARILVEQRELIAHNDRGSTIYQLAPQASLTRQKVSLNSSHSSTARRFYRLLLMISELHKLGLHGLRIYNYKSPNGAALRCVITHKSNLIGLRSLAKLKVTGNSASVTYSNGSIESIYQGVHKANGNARQMAQEFLDAFPRLCSLACIDDYEYAGWFTSVLAAGEQDCFPVTDPFNHIAAEVGEFGYAASEHARWMYTTSLGENTMPDAYIPWPP